MRADFLRIAFFAQRLPVVFKISDQLFLFGVDGNSGLTFDPERLQLGINIFKLCIAIRVVAAFFGLGIGLQTEAHIPQQTSHRLVRDAVASGLQGFRQMSLAGADP